MRILLLLLILHTPCLGALHGPNPPDLPELSFTLEELGAYLRFLASDELEGRRTGTPGNRVAARYVAEHFRSWGLREPPGLAGFLQPVPLFLQTPPSEGIIDTGSDQLHPGVDFLLLAGKAQLEAPVVFAGHGLVDLELGIDDYSDLDVKGKLVVVEFGTPTPMSALSQGSRRRSWSSLKRSLASQRGAVGILEMTSRNRWRRFSKYLSGPRIVFKQDLESNRDGLFHSLVLTSSEDPPEWTTLQVNVPPFQGKALDTSNVIGVIKGTDPELRDEYVVVTAHYDHLGKGSNLPGATGEDSIFNGARDNGMGVVALLAAARALSLQAPRRSAVFIAATGEEQGLLGSSYYVNHPAIPLKQNVFVLNTDGAGFSDTEVVTVFGLSRTSARSLIEAACSPFKLEAVPEPVENKDLFYRSDNLPFAQKGIPALTFSPGFRTMDDATLKYYHRPDDEAGDDFDYLYLLRFSQAFVSTVRALANTEQVPEWLDGDEFKEVWRLLQSNKD